MARSKANCKGMQPVLRLRLDVRACHIFMPLNSAMSRLVSLDPLALVDLQNTCSIAYSHRNGSDAQTVLQHE